MSLCTTCKMSMDPIDEDKINALQRWFNEHIELPKLIHRVLLKRFYYCMLGNEEDTKRLILSHYTLRRKHRKIFLLRDPVNQNCRKTFDYIDMCLLPGLTPEKHKITFFRLCDYDANKVNHMEDTKTFLMLLDCRFIINDVADDPKIMSTGEIQILDIAGITMEHMQKLSLSTLRMYVNYLQEALPVRLKAIHVINCPSFMNVILSTIRPAINNEVFKLIKLHSGSLEDLYEHVPRDMLPEEYGGKAGKICELKSNTIDILMENRHYLCNPFFWTFTGTK